MEQLGSDHLRKSLKIVFVGYNPSLRSGNRHHFANATNRFWKVLIWLRAYAPEYKPQEDALY